MLKNKICCDCRINQACENAYPKEPPCGIEKALSPKLPEFEEAERVFVEWHRENGDSEITSGDLRQKFYDIIAGKKEKTQGKSQSKRIRNVLYVLWKVLTEKGDTNDDFNTFYMRKTEQIIEWLKDKLPERR